MLQHLQIVQHVTLERIRHWQLSKGIISEMDQSEEACLLGLRSGGASVRRASLLVECLDS